MIFKFQGVRNLQKPHTWKAAGRDQLGRCRPLQERYPGKKGIQATVRITGMMGNLENNDKGHFSLVKEEY